MGMSLVFGHEPKHWTNKTSDLMMALGEKSEWKV